MKDYVYRIIVMRQRATQLVRTPRRRSFKPSTT
jgi:hypothetical protein